MHAACDDTGLCQLYIWAWHACVSSQPGVLSPGFADDVALQQAQLCLCPGAEDEVHMAGHLAICQGGGLLGSLPAAIEVLNHSQHWGHLQRAAQTSYQQFSVSSPSNIGHSCEQAQVQSTWAALMLLHSM